MAEGEVIMKKEIQPNYNVIIATCQTCGTEIEVGTVASADKIKVDTCSNCHPFYTGTQTYTAAAGRVDRFNKRYGRK